MITDEDRLNDLTRNPKPTSLENAKKVLRLMEKLNGARETLHFVCPNGEIEEKLLDSVKKAESYQIREKGKYEPKKDLISLYVAQNGMRYLKTGTAYRKNEIIMKIYGSLDYPNDDLDSKEIMIKTCFGMIIKGDDYGGPWRYLKKSCQPNVAILEGWEEDEKGIPRYVCLLVALTNIPKGDLLRICRNELMKENINYDCDCDELNCVRDRNSRWRCTVEGCIRKGGQFPNEQAFEKHMEKHDREQAIADGAPLPPRPRVVCEDCPADHQDYSSYEAMRRHWVQEHGEGHHHYCPHCNEEFTRKEAIGDHLKSKKGCPVLKAKLKKAKSTTEIGPRYKLVKDKPLKKDGKLVRERTGSSEEESGNEEGRPIEFKAPRAVSAPAAPRRRAPASRMTRASSRVTRQTAAQTDNASTSTAAPERTSRSRAIARPSSRQGQQTQTTSGSTSTNMPSSSAATCQPSTSAQAYGNVSKTTSTYAAPTKSSKAKAKSKNSTADTENEEVQPKKNVNKKAGDSCKDKDGKSKKDDGKDKDDGGKKYNLRTRK